MKRLIVGDIHACFTELEELLQVAGISEDDEVIGIGDIVDRGPEPQKVLDFFRQRPRARSVMGNHARKHLRSFQGEVQPALSQIITRGQLGEERYREALAFLATLPAFIELPEAILVHAFFEPGIALAAQRDNVIIGTLSGEGHLKKKYSQPWYKLYDGPKRIIVGHHDYLGNGKPFIHADRVFALDTSCCLGGRLTGLVLPDFRIVSVASRRNYWQEATQRHAAQC